MEAWERGQDRPAFGVLVRNYRVAAGLTQEALAELARMSRNGIGALERGDRLVPQRETIALLAQALGLTPDQRAAFEAAAHRPSHPRSRQERIPAEPDARRNELPVSLTSFVGRDAECAQIAALVREHRLVTLTGTGGIGKTRAALQVGNLAIEAATNVRLVELAAVHDASLVMTTVARAAGILETPDSTTMEALVAFLRHESLLLILDNCEHVIAQVHAIVTAIVRDSPSVHVLATSREPLKVAGEHIYRLPSLRVPSIDEDVAAEAARQYGALALFADRALASDARFAITDQNAPIVADICRRLDGIPLAIELAAARVKVLAPRQLAQKLHERFRLLTGGDRNALPRHQTMRALIDWSYDLLTNDERRMFRSLSIFRGGFTFELADAVVGKEFELLDVLSSLVDKSLVGADFSGEETRYALLESTREYAREKLAESGEHEAVARAHATAYLGLAEHLERLWGTTPDRLWNAQSEPELENWRAALEWALAERGDVLLGERLVVALSHAWWDLPSEEGRRWLDVALASSNDAQPPALLAKLQLTSARFDAVVNQYEPSLAAAESALERYRELDDALGIADAQRIAGRALLFMNRFREAEEMLDAALDAYRSLGARRRIAQVLHNLATASDMAGDVDLARSRLAAAVTIFEETGADVIAASIMVDLAETEFHAGDVVAALRISEDALEINRAQPRGCFIWRTLSNRAAYLIAAERYDEARNDAREALGLARAAQHDTTVAFAMQHLAAVAAFQPAEDSQRARERLAHAARLLGYVEGRLIALGPVRDFTEQREADALHATLDRALNAGELAALMHEGRGWPADRAVAEALGGDSV
jgi:predicted ATPase/DNA-binding XRE family transcriptional regulator